MLKTLGVVQIHAQTAPQSGGGPLLPARRFAGRTLLEWIVRRASESLLLDEVAVVAPAGPAYESLARLVPSDVRLHFGQGDALSQLLAASDAHRAQAVVRIGVEHPFVDPALIDRLACSAESSPGCDYASFCLRDGRPACMARLGLFAEWCRADALRRADREAVRAEDRGDPLRYLCLRPEQFTLRLLPVPPALDRDDLRLALLRPEDWEHAQAIFDALPADRLDWQSVANLLEQHPGLRQRMAALNESESAL